LTAAVSRVALLALAVGLLCAACGSSTIKGRPPFVSISSMALQDGALAAVFDVRNQNDVPMTVQAIEITVTVNKVELTRHNADFNLLVGANSTEEVPVEKLPEEFTRSLLASLDQGEVKSLPFDLSGRVLTVEDGYLVFEHTGFLYPVPGRPGRFRSTATQARGLEREGPY
jgi:LEA14-like dessication related protein